MKQLSLISTVQSSETGIEYDNILLDEDSDMELAWPL
jgi:hypothetical protein